MKFYTMIMFMMFTLTTTTFASSYEREREHVQELENSCLQAQNKLLDVEREKKIKICIEVDKREEAYCRRYFEKYGVGNYAPADIRNKIRALPECVEAHDARKALNR